MNYILITGEVFEKIIKSIGYKTPKINAKEILDLEKMIELRVPEVFKRCNVPDSNLVEVYYNRNRVVILSGDNVIYTNSFFKNLKVEKRGSFPKHGLPPGDKK